MIMAIDVDFYELLEVERTADDGTLKSSYRKLAMRWNQSACPNEDGARTRRVGSYAPSPDLPGARIWDLSGNIYEWTADNLVPYDGPDRRGCWGSLPGGRVNPVCNVEERGARTIRGGSWFFTTLGVMRSASRFGAEMGGSLPLYGIGLRCARTR